jgi:hypothetical protein
MAVIVSRMRAGGGTGKTVRLGRYLFAPQFAVTSCVLVPVHALQAPIGKKSFLTAGGKGNRPWRADRSRDARAASRCYPVATAYG